MLYLRMKPATVYVNNLIIELIDKMVSSVRCVTAKVNRVLRTLEVNSY